MPIVTNANYAEPAPSEMLWRYMDLAKFISIATSQGLWFSNAQELAKIDPYEGFFPGASTSWVVPFDPNIGGEAVMGVGLDPMAQVIFANPRQAEIMRGSFSINCWHSASEEAFLMWKSYGVHDFAVAIVSDLGRMQKAFAKSPENIFCGRISYTNYADFMSNFKNGEDIIMNKRLPFKSENEVRLVYTHGIGKFPQGLSIRCSLDDLIAQLWISPTAPPWFAQSVQAFCKLAGLACPVAVSPLLTLPHLIAQDRPRPW